MKLKWTGNESITLRDVTFEAGKTVDLSDNPNLFEKARGIEGFEEVKARKPKKADE